MDGEGWQDIGAHAWRLEPPDLFCLDVVGDVCADDARRVVGALARCFRSAGRLYTLTDLSRMGDISHEGRKASVYKDEPFELRAQLFVGAGFAQRVVIKLIISADRLVRRDTDPAPLLFFDAEPEARAWIEQDRQRRSAPGGSR
jgi:hypothetical protein